MFTQTILRELLDYDPETGVFRWRQSTRRGWTGRKAGTLTSGKQGGYTVIKIEGETFRAARLACLYMTGEWPAQGVDHINRNRADDRWSNLRLATQSENMANTCARKDNTSGYRGVFWNAARGKWVAQMSFNKRQYYCGLFATAEEAAAARDAKATALQGQFAQLNNLPKGVLQ